MHKFNLRKRGKAEKGWYNGKIATKIVSKCRYHEFRRARRVTPPVCWETFPEKQTERWDTLPEKQTNLSQLNKKFSSTVVFETIR